VADIPQSQAKWTEENGLPTRYFYQLILDLWRVRGPMESYTAAEIEQVALTPGATIYTCPSGRSAEVIYANATNESGGAVLLTVHIVQSGGSLADTNIYLDGKSIAAGASDGLTKITGEAGKHGCILSAGDFIIIFADTADALNVKLGIREITN